MKSRDKRLKERGRGAIMMVSRWLGAVAVIIPISAYSQGNLSSELLFTLLLVAVLWQVVLLRTGIRVQGSVLTVRGLLSDTKIPLQSIMSFGVVRRRTALDQFDRSVNLVIRLTDGSEIVCRWVAWQDLLTPLFVSGERPLPTTSQRRVLDRLNDTLTEPYEV